MAGNKITKLDHLRKLAEKVKQEVETLEFNIENKGYQTEAQVQHIVNTKIGSVYHPAGSVDVSVFEERPVEADLGKVYNAKETFTTTEYFIEGRDKQYPAGTDVAVIEEDGEYYYNVLAGFVDLANYPTNEQLTAKLEYYLPKAEAGKFITQEDLDGYLTEDDIAQNSEVEQMLANVFDEA